MRRCRDTPDWSISTFPTMSLTECSPPRRISTMRSRVGSPRVWSVSTCITVHMYHSAYVVARLNRRVKGGDSAMGNSPRNRTARISAPLRSAPRALAYDALRLVQWKALRALRAMAARAQSYSHPSHRSRQSDRRIHPFVWGQSLRPLVLGG